MKSYYCLPRGTLTTVVLNMQYLPAMFPLIFLGDIIAQELKLNVALAMLWRITKQTYRGCWCAKLRVVVAASTELPAAGGSVGHTFLQENLT